MSEPLGNEWGPLAGMEPEEALKQIAELYTESSTELAQVKAQLEKLTDKGGEPPLSPPAQPGPDIKALQTATPEEAQKMIGDYTRQVAEELVDKRLSGFRDQTYAMDRHNAKRTARGQIGDDFERFEPHLDQYLTEEKGVSKEAQINPETWKQAYTYLLGQETMGNISVPGGTEPGSRGSTFVEKPTYGSRQNAPGSREERLDDPNERHAHAMWEKQLGRKIPVREWVAFRDRIRTVEDHDEWKKEEEARQKRGGR